MSLSTMLESLATLKRPTISRDANKGVVQTFATIVEDVPCSVQQAGVSVLLLYAQRNMQVNTTIYFDQNIGAAVNDILESADRSGTVHTYHVHGPSQPVVGRTIGGGSELWQVDAQKLT